MLTQSELNELRQDMLDEARQEELHETKLRNDMEYCLDYFCRDDVVKAFCELLDNVREYHDVSCEELVDYYN